MRRISHAFLASLSLWWGGICFADTDLPKQIRVCIQLIEVPHPSLTELLGDTDTSGSVLHAKATALAKEGKAKLLDTAMVVCRSTQKAELESIRELIYPTEYTPTCVGLFSPAELPQQPQTPPWRPFPFSAFESRNFGLSLAIEPTSDERGQIIDLRIAPEWVTLDRFKTVMEHHDRWGEASLRMPVFETWRAITSVTLQPGKFELLSVITPKKQAHPPAVANRILWFVRADLIRVGD